jgi:hypothetical protein
LDDANVCSILLNASQFIFKPISTIAKRQKYFQQRFLPDILFNADLLTDKTAGKS